MKKRVMMVFLVLLSIQTQGCALIFKSPNASIPVTTTPPDADIIVIDEKGKEVFSGKSPTIVKLEKSAGPFLGGKKYLINISRPGYKTKIYPIVPVPNNYYLFGNLMTSYIGYFIDPNFGNMYDLEPPLINARLTKSELSSE